MSKEYQISRLSVSELFGKGRAYLIPSYQRDYAWDKDNAEHLFDDLIEMASSDERSSAGNLLGAIVVVGGEDGFEFEVVDGQQRLATLSMIFCGIRTTLLKFKSVEEGTAGAVLDEALNGLDKLLRVQDKAVNKIRVELGEVDSTLFQKIITNKRADYHEFCNDLFKEYEGQKKRIKKSHALIIDNYCKLCERAEQWIKEQGLEKACKNGDTGKFSRAILSMNSHISNMTEYSDFAFIVAPDRYLAYRIFNTFNARGLKLNQVDLIKSHFLNKVGNNASPKNFVQTEWQKIFNEDLDDHDKFLYESISSRNPTGSINGIKITQDNLYRIIDTEVRSTSDVKRWLEYFKEDADFLKIMDHPDDLPTKQKFEKIRSGFYGIQTLKARYIRVPILAAYRIWKDVTKMEFQELVECLLIFFFRFKFINDGTAEDVRAIANKVTRQLEAREPLSKIVYYILVDEDVLGRPSKRISEENFEENFKKKMYKMQMGVAKYILASIEMSLRRSKGKEKSYIEYNFG